jgi:uncharacterized membrane protein YedE/YeeE
MFPIGVYPYIVGGLIIGLGVSLVYILTGTHATQSTFFSTTLSYFSQLPYFQRKSLIDQRVWRLYFVSGLIIGALIYTFTISPDGIWVTSLPVWRLIIGGFLVGFGVRLSSGCTSGHGISGISSLSSTSLYATLTFLIVGIITANILNLLGVI